MDAVVIQSGCCHDRSLCLHVSRLAPQGETTAVFETESCSWCTGVSFLPLILFLLLFFAAVGLEELTGAGWISELFTRPLVPSEASLQVSL